MASDIVLLLWCYCAAQIILFGAEFPRVSDLTDGGRDFSRPDRQVKHSMAL